MALPLTPPSVSPAPAHAARPCLHAGFGLTVETQACRALRVRAAGCEACACACPVSAITVDADLPAVGSACTGCGRCAVACPMGALSLSGFESLHTKTPPRTVRLECQVAAFLPDTAHARIVPCLGGVDAAALIALHPHQKRTPLENRPLEDMDRAMAGPVLVDRGLCAQCPSGKGEGHPAAAALEKARGLLAAMGVSEALQPVLQAKIPALPAGIAPRHDPAPASRRAFFKRLSASVPPAMAPMAAQEARRLAGRAQTSPSRARLRLLSACLALARARVSPLPASLFPKIDISDACCSQGLCHALCPTGALSQHTDENRGEAIWHFDAMACINCGLCVRACPENAVSLSVRTAAHEHAPERLRTQKTQHCTECGAVVRPPSGEETDHLCLSCHRSRTLMRSLF